MFDVLRLITTVRIVPRILTAFLISLASAAAWPIGALTPLHQVLLLWPVSTAGLYILFLLIHPRFAYMIAGVLLSGGLAGLALRVGIRGTEVLGDLSPIHPAWFAAMLVQAAVWWAEGDGWQRLTQAD